jgi:NHS family xanthosine MFS transporter
LGIIGLAQKGWSGAEFSGVFNSWNCVNNTCTNRIIADGLMPKNYTNITYLKRICYFYIPQVDDPTVFFYWAFFMMCFICLPLLSNSVAYNILKNNNFDVKVFPPISLGTIGFIAMWMTNLSGNKASVNMFYIGLLL